jgi:hypothetical protein
MHMPRPPLLFIASLWLKKEEKSLSTLMLRRQIKFY